MSGGEVTISAKQFLAIVGDETDEIKNLLIKALPHDSAERAIIIENNYYRAEVGIQHFSNIKSVVDGIAHEKAFPAVFIQFDGVSKLPEYAESLKNINVDVKVIVVKTPVENEDDGTELERWAIDNYFEVVYLVPTIDQIKVAQNINEKIGVDRLVETLNVCDWPNRKHKIPKVHHEHLDRMLKILEDSEGSSIEPLSMDHPTAELIYDEYLRIRQLSVATAPRSFPSQTPEPQHAEHVHLPDSPTDTDATNQENEVAGVEETVSAEFDLTCSLAGQSNTASGNVPDLASDSMKKINNTECSIINEEIC